MRYVEKSFFKVLNGSFRGSSNESKTSVFWYLNMLSEMPQIALDSNPLIFCVLQKANLESKPETKLVSSKLSSLSKDISSFVSGSSSLGQRAMSSVLPEEDAWICHPCLRIRK